MLSHTKRQVINFETVATSWLIYLNCIKMHGLANVKLVMISFHLLYGLPSVRFPKKLAVKILHVSLAEP